MRNHPLTTEATYPQDLGRTVTALPHPLRDMLAGSYVVSEYGAAYELNSMATVDRVQLELFDMARAMCLQSRLPPNSFGLYALEG